MIFCNSQQLIISCWTYPNYYYWDWSSLIFLLLNLNNCIIFFIRVKIQVNKHLKNVVGKICSQGKPEFHSHLHTVHLYD